MRRQSLRAPACLSAQPASPDVPSAKARWSRQKGWRRGFNNLNRPVCAMRALEPLNAPCNTENICGE